jgi:uncharacterized protein
MMIKRLISKPERSFFLLGPRQTGKSTWIKSLHLENQWMVNLLKNDTFFRYIRNPAVFRLEAQEKINNGCEWIIIDEVQRIPDLLNDVHLMLESSNVKFILSGSSARKLKQKEANMLGGRALKRHLHPFTVKEINSAHGATIDLDTMLVWGTLPPLHGLNSRDASETLKAYVEVYLREEIQQEALVRNLGGYARFLDLTAAYCGEIVNFTSIGKEAGLPTRTVQSYYEILEDTLIALRLPAWRKSPTKRLLSHPKMYLFDNGVTNFLCHRLRKTVDPTLKGRLFEQFMVQETNRILDYSGIDYQLYYWRTNHGAEVDLLIRIDGSLSLAVEFKSKSRISRGDTSGIASFHEDNPEVPCFIVSLVPEPYALDYIHVMNWQQYLEKISGDLS